MREETCMVCKECKINNFSSGLVLHLTSNMDLGKLFLVILFTLTGKNRP